METAKFKALLSDKVIGGMFRYMSFFDEDEECPFRKLWIRSKKPFWI